MYTALGLLEGFGVTEMLLVGLLVIVLFGSTKIPELARSLGKAKSEYKRGEREGLRELEREEDLSALQRQAREKGIPTEGKSADELRRALAAIGHN